MKSSRIYSDITVKNDLLILMKSEIWFPHRFHPVQGYISSTKLRVILLQTVATDVFDFFFILILDPFQNHSSNLSMAKNWTFLGIHWKNCGHRKWPLWGPSPRPNGQKLVFDRFSQETFWQNGSHEAPQSGHFPWPPFYFPIKISEERSDIEKESS